MDNLAAKKLVEPLSRLIDWVVGRGAFRQSLEGELLTEVGALTVSNDFGLRDPALVVITDIVVDAVHATSEVHLTFGALIRSAGLRLAGPRRATFPTIPFNSRHRSTPRGHFRRSRGRFKPEEIAIDSPR